MTTTVVAAVVAAPVLALWAAYHHEPPSGDAQVTPVSVNDSDGGGSYAYENSGNAGAVRPTASGSGAQSASPSASAPASPATSTDGAAPPAAPGSPPSATGTAPGGGTASPGPGRLTVTAAPQGDDTVITLTDEGGSALRWSASCDASWLRLGAATGELRPGQSVTVTVAVDHATEPAGAWSGRITSPRPARSSP